MKKNLVLSGLVLGGTLFTSFSTFAYFGEGVSETTYSENPESSFNKNERMRGNFYHNNKRRLGVFMKLKQFMDQDLTDQQKEELKEVIQTHRDSAKELFVEYKPESGEKLDEKTKEEMKQKFKELKETFFQSLEEFVDDEKMQDYQGFVEKELEREIQTPRVNRRSYNKKRKYIVGSVTAFINQKLSSMTQDQLSDLSDKIQQSIQNISNKDEISDSQKQKYISIYSELDSMVERFIDSKNSDVNDILEEIF